MTLEEMLVMEAKIYIALAEIDYELRAWSARHYSPSRAMMRAMIPAGFYFNRMKERIVWDRFSASSITRSTSLPPS